MRRIFLPLLVLTGAILAGSSADYLNAKKKIELIADGQASPGSTIRFTPAEVNDYARTEIRNGNVAGAIRNDSIRLEQGAAVWSAIVDFSRLPDLKSLSSNWLLGRLLQGEKPVSVRFTLESGRGYATVNVVEVTISGVTFQGESLAFLAQTLVRSRYADANLGEPFELDHNIERILLQRSGVDVLMFN